jgi:hypothetical protein
VLTTHDARTPLEVATEVRAFIGPKVLYDTMIPRNVRVDEAPSFGKPICSTTMETRAARPTSGLRPSSLCALADELPNRLGRRGDLGDHDCALRGGGNLALTPLG